MKNIVFIISVLLMVSACSYTKEGHISRSENRESKKLAKQELVKSAVESRMYILKMNRLYTYHGGFVDLVPRNNYIIINGSNAQISLGYLGRQYMGRRVSGINFRGETVKYDLKSNETKGIYNIDLKVKASQGNYLFDVYITIGSDGFCSASVANALLESVRYSGQLVPITEIKNIAPEKGKRL